MAFGVEAMFPSSSRWTNLCPISTARCTLPQRRCLALAGKDPKCNKGLRIVHRWPLTFTYGACVEHPSVKT